MHLQLIRRRVDIRVVRQVAFREIQPTDPIKALGRIRSVTREVAIIATGIHPLQTAQPLAQFVGQQRGDAWWLSNRAALEAMITAAGFQGWEWFSEFRLDWRSGEPGLPHAAIRAWNTPQRPALLDAADQPPSNLALAVPVELPEVQALRHQVVQYEQMKFAGPVRWLHPYRQKLRAWLKRPGQL